MYYPVENSKTILQLWNIYPDRAPILRAELSTGIWQQELMTLEAFQELAFSSDSRLLATASGDGTTQIWNVASGQMLHTLPTGSKIYFSPDNKYLATLDKDSARIWNISSGKPQIIWEISGFNRWSYDIAFARDGQELVDVTDEYYKFFPATNANLTAPSYLINDHAPLPVYLNTGNVYLKNCCDTRDRYYPRFPIPASRARTMA